MVAPRAPAVAMPTPRNLRRVVLPLYQMSFAQGSLCHRSAIDCLLSLPANRARSGKVCAPTYTNRSDRASVAATRAQSVIPPAVAPEARPMRTNCARPNWPILRDIRRGSALAQEAGQLAGALCLTGD